MITPPARSAQGGSGGTHGNRQGPGGITSGDRGIVSVSPWPGEQRAPWSCERCSERIAMGEAWELTYRDDRGRTGVFVVGPLCAHELMPIRATVDLVALEQRTDELPEVASLVRHIQRSRRPSPRYELRVRSSDVCLLAAVRDETPAQFALRLRATGVLIGL